MPFESDMMSAMPMMPMLPAKAVRMVRVFLVSRLFVERPSAVRKLIEVFFPAGADGSHSTEEYGALSAVITPSLRRIVRLA